MTFNKKTTKRTSRYILVLKFTKIIVNIVSLFSGKSVQLPEISKFGKFLNGMEFMIQHRGITETIRLYKEYYRIAQKIVLGLPFEAIPFHKVIRGTNVPIALRPLYKFLKSGNVWPRRIALTYARAYTLLVTTPHADLKPIITPGVDLTPESLMDFQAMCAAILAPAELPVFSSKPTYPSSTGPNGHAVLNSHIDAVALRREGLLKLWREIADAVYHPLRSSLDHILATYKEDEYPWARTGKLSFLPEKGGKTRTIAIGDYWSQQLLKGFHNKLMSILRTKFVGPDSTFNQNEGFNRVKSLSHGRGCYSYDLKSASDRVPMALQRIVLTTIWPEYGDKVADLLCKRDFFVKGQKPVRWAVGQPLGMYSSWPLFTLTHHLIIQMASRLVGFKELFLDYQVLGDDVVIWDKRVAGAYVELMETYGVTISKEKSLLSPEYSSGEFCKRLFLNGIELSPLSLNVILQGNSIFGIPLIYNQLL
jgi:hypothetical protein